MQIVFLVDGFHDLVKQILAFLLRWAFGRLCPSRNSKRGLVSDQEVFNSDQHLLSIVDASFINPERGHLGIKPTLEHDLISGPNASWFGTLSLSLFVWAFKNRLGRASS
jgi:hypothetical protein